MTARPRWLAAALLAALLAGGGPVRAQARPAGAAAGPAAVDLGGTLVAALAAEGELWLLVRPAAEPDGPRRLLHVGAAGLTPRTLLTGLPGWIKTLAAMDLGSGPELLAGGLGEIATLGPLAAPAATPRTLVGAPDVDLRSLAPHPLRRGVEPWLAVASAGRTRLFTAAAGALREAFAAPLPVAIEPEGGGLRIASPPGAALDRGPGRLPLLVFGPEPSGRSRLRTTILDPEAAGAARRQEAWSRLPGPERVEDHRLLRLDGAPWLVVRSQGSETVDALERQRLRVLRLRADPTRAGARPTFAAEVDSRRWQEVAFAAADLDGDGHDELVVARPEGYRGNSVVVEAYRGRGDGRFELRPWRTDVGGQVVAHALVEAPAGGAVRLATVAGGRLEVRPLRGGGGVLGAPEIAAALPLAPPVGEDAAARARRRGGVEPGVAVLGVVAVGPLPLVALVVETATDGAQRLFLAGGAPAGR